MSEWFRSYGFADVHEGLIVGAFPLDASDVRTVAALGVTRVLNLVQEREYPGDVRVQVEQALAGAGIVERRLGSEDFGMISAPHLEQCVRVVNAWLDEGQTVYLHCRAGWQRTAVVAAAALAVRDRVDPETVLRRIQTRKPSCEPLPHQLAGLRAWWADRQGSGTAAPD
ncbi:MAG: protein-tyrosine phosphatase family protein [Solirubrobacteraceae bacterium]